MIGCAADTHLMKRVWKGRRDMDGDSFRAFGAMKDSLIQLGAKALILAGDTFNASAVDGPCLQAFTDLVDGLYAHSIPVYYIQGNHDRDVNVAVPEIQGAVSLHGKTIRIDGMDVFGLDWMPREELQAAITQVPPCDLLVIHCQMPHLMEYEAAADISLEDIPAHVKNVLCGDTHVTDSTPMANGGFCISPGALHPCNIAQGDVHGFYKVEAGPALSAEFHEIPSRKIARFEAMDEEGMAEVEAVLPRFVGEEDHMQPIVEIRHITQLSDRVQALVSKYGSLVKIFTKPSIAGKFMTSGMLKEAQMSLDELSLEGSLEDVVDPQQEDEAYNFIMSLLTSNKEATQEILERRMACAQ